MKTKVLSALVALVFGASAQCDFCEPQWGFLYGFDDWDCNYSLVSSCNGFRPLIVTKDTNYYRLCYDTLKMDAFRDNKLNTTKTPTNFLWADAKGTVYKTSLVKTFSAPNRSLDSTFVIGNKDATVSYTIHFTASVVDSTANGHVDLEYSTNSGTTWVIVSSASLEFNNPTTINTSHRINVAGMIPAGATVRIHKISNNNISISITAQQEVY
jgi:hypothetical protein